MCTSVWGYSRCMDVWRALLWSSRLVGVCKDFVFTVGNAKWATWYPHCALCVSAEGFQLHLQGSSRADLWLLWYNAPPHDIPIWRNVRPQPPTAPLLMFLHLANKSPGFFPPSPASCIRHPRVAFSSLGSCLISEHDAMARGSISIMSTWLVYVKDMLWEHVSRKNKEARKC